MAKELTDKGIVDAAKDLGVEPAAIRAVDEVESKGDGFISDGRVKILFERHKFHKYSNGQYSASHPDISNRSAGGYGKAGAHQYARFSQAFELDPEAAMMSASWGRYQIMGFNHVAAGFDTVGEFVDAMKISEDEQLKAFVKLIKSWGLAGELRAHDWAGFARQYNGAAYKKNRYDVKMAEAYERFKRMPETADKPDADKPSGDKPDSSDKVQTVSSEPPVVEVHPPGTSITTKIAAATAAAAPVLSGIGLKVGGVEFKTGGLIAMAAVIIVGMLLAAWLWNASQQRRHEELKLSMQNLADRNKNNVIAGGSQT